MFSKRTDVPTVLSAGLRDIWPLPHIRHLIVATTDYIVFIDASLDVDWKTTSEFDKKRENTHRKFATILSKAATIEASDWEGSDERKTINFKRQIGEAIARGLEGNFGEADELLNNAEEYRRRTIEVASRREVIKDHVKIKNSWNTYFKFWTVVHYVLGTLALLLSTLVASKPTWLNTDEISLTAWLVAAFTALLTFLTPDKKADKYIRAWSVLNSEITLYNADEDKTIEDVMEAYHRGNGIIYDTPDRRRR